MNSALGMGQMLTESAVGITVGDGCDRPPSLISGPKKPGPRSLTQAGFLSASGLIRWRKPFARDYHRLRFNPRLELVFLG